MRVPRFVVNVASEEYWKVVGPHAEEIFGDQIQVYTIKFPGPAVYAKQARGMYCRFLCQRSVLEPSQLEDFAAWTETSGAAVYKRSDNGSKPYVLEFSRVGSGKPAKPAKKPNASDKPSNNRQPPPKRARRR
eukprot:TRINITY_DN25567_c0_g1_i1.p1 TRINITY_DN25567_c0_g1~~TRINITY_DN25567_c0_g1_i1.p1  ORF type:complete len:132 (-),score=7.30 TRINITY_DN25567_c0_g1_i1:100-495(-)